MLHRQFTTPHSTPQCMRIFQQSMRHRHTWHKQVGLLRLAHGLDAYRTPREEAWHQSVTVDSRLLFCEDPADFRNLLVKVRDSNPTTAGSPICCSYGSAVVYPGCARMHNLYPSVALRGHITPISSSSSSQAGNRLVVVEVMSPDVCESGLSEEAELHWREDQRAQISKCSNLKHSLQRVAAECPDVCFLAVDVDSKSDPMCLELGISTIPSLLFFRDGRKLWEHRGVNNLEQELGEGVLYYGDTAANNEKASTFVQELHTRDDLQRFVRTQPRDVLTVINVSMTICDPCIQIYPAVLALAKSFQVVCALKRFNQRQTCVALCIQPLMPVNLTGVCIVCTSNWRGGRRV